jgi:hypothetical protein
MLIIKMMNNLKKITLVIYWFATSLIVEIDYASAQNKAFLFPEAPGIVSYTYRDSFAKDVPATLDRIKANGITDIEFSNKNH